MKKIICLLGICAGLILVMCVTLDLIMKLLLY